MPGADGLKATAVNDFVDPERLASADRSAPPRTVLCVDDERNSLAALKRVLRQDGHRVLTADDGEQALSILDRDPVDLVLSDMRMPGMDGAQLLEQVCQRWPHTVRVLLTGHADIASATAAINRGRIFRYLNKPWDDQELRATVEQGLSMRALELENLRLQQVTHEQNQQLQQVNAQLEQRVAARTAELSSAHERLKGRYLTSIKVFSGMIDLRGPKLAGHGRRVADTARKLAVAMGCDDTDAQQVFVAGLLHDIGLVGMSDAMLDKPHAKLVDDELARFRQHATVGSDLLMPLDDMPEVAALIRAHHERHDGAGFPDGLAGPLIPLGARILAIADTYDDMLSGALAGTQLKPHEACALLRLGRGTQFDPEVLDVFLQSMTATAAAPPKAAAGGATPSVSMTSEQVEPGMVLARDLVSSSGVLMLAAGHVLTPSLIERIRAFERREGGQITFHIRPRVL